VGGEGGNTMRGLAAGGNGTCLPTLDGELVSARE